ncbi:transposase [Actomonas aquatica]|uniref:Transposase n=1 Tax=Actomonas aquatica TaxID=2866162 RepID=A0ABZ1C217_9BACT|nr:transposase [Opitutus sp. WL0086]WRQ85570.1 transposase [Opitutus sp. WL0086]
MTEPFAFFNPTLDVYISQGDLPHWRQPRALYFVTFRTADSLPHHLIEAWRIQREDWLNQHPKPWDEATADAYRERFPRQLQRSLDQAHGECLLRDKDLRELVDSSLRRFHQERYWLDEHVVAANHVHALIAPLGTWELSRILHSWKSFTATAINKAAHRSGPFWQKESYDHIVRNPIELEHIRNYIKAHK